MLAPGRAAFSDILPAQPLASQISYSALGFSGSRGEEGGILTQYPKEQKSENSTEM